MIGMISGMRRVSGMSVTENPILIERNHRTGVVRNDFQRREPFENAAEDEARESERGLKRPAKQAIQLVVSDPIV